MIFEPRIRLKPLTDLCHRLAIATSAGLEDRRIWRSEAERGSRQQQRLIGAVADQLERSQSITDALKEAGNYFPPLFMQMVAVGEMSGQLDRTYKRLAQHYDRTRAAQRAFAGQLAWPAFQLGMALFVVGLLIWIMGILPTAAGSDPTDLLGWGLIGTKGLIIYINILIAIAMGLLFVFESARRGADWTRTFQRKLLRVPVIGGALKTLCLAKITWALQLVLDTPMDLRKALPLALATSGNEYYAKHGPAVAGRIQDGMSLHMALAETGVLPIDLLDAIAVGEEAGSLVETMQRQADIYQDRAASAMNILAQVFGYAMWLLVAIFIISLIFRLASFWLNAYKAVGAF